MAYQAFEAGRDLARKDIGIIDGELETCAMTEPPQQTRSSSPARVQARDCGGGMLKVWEARCRREHDAGGDVI
jgi:hypothetical protein